MIWTDRYGPCMCGALDCSSCGPAQGYYEYEDEGEEPEEESEDE